MQTTGEKFQVLLKELFQFDCADLDFGIYRIMNHKRQVIEHFINEDLPQVVNKELSQGSLAAQTRSAKDLEGARRTVLEALGDEALDADGQLDAKYSGTKAGKAYLAAQENAKSAKGHEALEAAVYNHLYAFFSRYWQDGDFISRRRYSKKERYAIPYNGEEVMLYWANHDQYYIKTGEYFTDYSWKAPNGTAVFFKLKAADVEQNNVKGEKRFFLPLVNETEWTADAHTLVIPFEFRPLTKQEAISYGQKNQQEAIIAKALETIPKRLSQKKETDALAALTAEKRKTDAGETVTQLEHHLRQYARRNTSDFFIHKDLMGFLSRELDFYLKNEVLNLEEMDAAGEGLSEGWFQLMRLIKKVGSRIIEFLAQIEDFQKMLWEKKKFVTEAFYVVTLGSIQKEFHAEIAACDAQWEEWKKLGMISDESGKVKKAERSAFLTKHPSLPLDTRHFSADFTGRLLASFDDMDGMTDGLLVHSENWQALNLMTEKYRQQVKCIYIDPPFNSPSTAILYKNDYKHSSWLSLLANRITLTKHLLPRGIYIVAIDENEQERLGLLLEQSWFQNWKKVCVSIRHNPRGIQGRNFSHCHEYAYFLYPSDDKKYIGDRVWDEPDVRNLRDSGLESDRSDARNCFYPIMVHRNRIVEIGDVPSDKFHPKGVNERNPDGTISIWPIDTSGREKKWRYARQSVDGILAKLEVRETRGKIEIYFAKDMGTVRTLWTEALFDASEYGTKLLQDMFGTKDLDFSYPKSLFTLIETLRVALNEQGNQNVLDYFGGSGTTAHATINLNREDASINSAQAGRRQFILVEMGQYFDTVLLPRIKKVAFSPEWKDGRAKRPATKEEAERGPRIVKVMRLESYEDSLNNLSFEEASAQSAMQFEDYLLSYMLRWETRKSETLLNVEKLSKPFSYKLHTHRNGETDERAVDLAETFNYLIGLNVQTRRVLPSTKKEEGESHYLVYRGVTREGRKTVVIWRDNEGWEEADYKRDRDFAAEHKLTDGADDVYVNGDSLIPGSRALEQVFKTKMFGAMEVQS